MQRLRRIFYIRGVATPLKLPEKSANVEDRRFTDEPTSKVFQNGWYKKNFVDPVWEQYSKAQNTYLSKLQAVTASEKGLDYVGILKLVYRLGIVFLCMMLVHRIRGEF